MSFVAEDPHVIMRSAVAGLRWRTISCHVRDALLAYTRLSSGECGGRGFGHSGHRACTKERQVSHGQRTLGPIWRRTSASRLGELAHPTLS